MTLPELLKMTVDLAGSDLHIATDTPPQVSTRSEVAAARRSASRVAARVSGTMPKSTQSQPKACNSPRSV